MTRAARPLAVPGFVAALVGRPGCGPAAESVADAPVSHAGVEVASGGAAELDIADLRRSTEIAFLRANGTVPPWSR